MFPEVAAGALGLGMQNAGAGFLVAATSVAAIAIPFAKLAAATHAYGNVSTNFRSGKWWVFSLVVLCMLAFICVWLINARRVLYYERRRPTGLSAFFFPNTDPDDSEYERIMDGFLGLTFLIWGIVVGLAIAYNVLCGSMHACPWSKYDPKKAELEWYHPKRAWNWVIGYKSQE